MDFDGSLCSTEPELYFSEDEADIQAAKALCRRCPIERMSACFRVALECDRDAIKSGVDGFGVYAGMTPEERRPHVDRLMRPKSQGGVSSRPYMMWTPEKMTVLLDMEMRGVSRVKIAAALDTTVKAVNRRIARLREEVGQAQTVTD